MRSGGGPSRFLAFSMAKAKWDAAGVDAVDVVVRGKLDRRASKEGSLVRAERLMVCAQEDFLNGTDPFLENERTARRHRI